MEQTYPQFPPGFVFGAATAAYQIEGGIQADGKGPSTWDVFTAKPGKVADGSTGETACDTYQNPQTDINLMADLGLNAYRFSTAWARIMPEGKGTVNQNGLDYYSRLVDSLLAKDITPYITLFHWDMPEALFQTYRGFASRETAHYFADYAEVVVKKLGDRVQNWITLNEPWEHAALGHLLGVHAPGIRNPWTYFKVAHNQLLAHGLGMERIRALSPQSSAGITLSLTPIFPASDSPQDQIAAEVGNQFFNQFYLDAVFKGSYPELLMKRARLLRPDIRVGDLDIIRHPMDFVGINYYSREFARAAWYVPFFRMWVDDGLANDGQAVIDGVQYTDMGWEVYPQGIYDLLLNLKNEYGNPLVYITENGAAFKDAVTDGQVHDPLRVSFLQAYLEKTAEAIRDGANVNGYFVWSLMDNFEWAAGYAKRFGIIHVDYDTQQRTIKDSGYWYRDLIRNQISKFRTLGS